MMPWPDNNFRISITLFFEVCEAKSQILDREKTQLGWNYVMFDILACKITWKVDVRS